MIISCNNCKKKFEVKENLIPENGRFLQCSQCSHKWFFKKKIITYKENNKQTIKEKELQKTFKKDIPNDVQKIITDAESIKDRKKTIPKNKDIKESKKISFFNLLLVIIITLSALILVLDTFKSPINNLYPDFNFILDNFYETLKDLFFFFKDLIR